MKIEHHVEQNGTLTLKLAGEMDAAGCALARDDLEEIVSTAPQQGLVLDISAVTFLDSSGIGMIVFLFKRLKADGRSLRIANVGGQPRELMQLLRIEKAIPVTFAEDHGAPAGEQQCAT
ncbi:MAG: STAS domain-containing protein [Chromatiales bacterium]|jgi:anti-anti-sigma factor